MVNEVFIEKGYIEAESVTFKEEVNEKTKKKRYFIEAKVLPFGKISRNRCLYTKTSAINTAEQIKGIPMMVNHIIHGIEARQIGEWESYTKTNEALYVRGRVYNMKSNEDVIEFLREASEPKVSLQVAGRAEQKLDSDKESYKEITIRQWWEISLIMGVSGFADAGVQSFEVAVAEAFKGNEDNKMEDKKEEIRKRNVSFSIEQADNGFVVSSWMNNSKMVFEDLDKALAELKVNVSKKYIYDTDTNAYSVVEDNKDDSKAVGENKDCDKDEDSKEFFNQLSEARNN